MKIKNLQEKKKIIEDHLNLGSYMNLKTLLMSSINFNEELNCFLFERIKFLQYEERFRQVFKKIKKEFDKLTVMRYLKFFIRRLNKSDLDSFFYLSMETVWNLEGSTNFGNNKLHKYNLIDDNSLDEKEDKIEYALEINSRQKNNDNDIIKMNERKRRNSVKTLISQFKERNSLELYSKDMILKKNWEEFFHTIQKFWNNLLMNVKNNSISEEEKKSLFFQFFQIKLYAEKKTIENSTVTNYIKYFQEENSDLEYIVGNYLEEKRRTLQIIDSSWIPSENFFTKIPRKFWVDLLKYNILKSLCYNSDKNQIIYKFLLGLIIRFDKIFLYLNSGKHMFEIEKKNFIDSEDLYKKFYAIFS